MYQVPELLRLQARLERERDEQNRRSSAHSLVQVPEIIRRTPPQSEIHPFIESQAVRLLNFLWGDVEEESFACADILSRKFTPAVASLLGEGGTEVTEYETTRPGIASLLGKVRKALYNNHVCAAYFTPILQRKKPHRMGRATQKNAHVATALVLDIDVREGFHPGAEKSGKLLPSIDQATAAIQEFNIQPSCTVWSGGGFQLYFKIHPLIFSTFDRKVSFRAAQRKLRDDFKRHIDGMYKKDFKIDEVDDLAHIFRLPGTKNLKKPISPRNVCINSPLSTWEVYDFADFAVWDGVFWREAEEGLIDARWKDAEPHAIFNWKHAHEDSQLLLPDGCYPHEAEHRTTVNERDISYFRVTAPPSDSPSDLEVAYRVNGDAFLLPWLTVFSRKHGYFSVQDTNGLILPPGDSPQERWDNYWRSTEGQRRKAEALQRWGEVASKEDHEVRKESPIAFVKHDKEDCQTSHKDGDVKQGIYISTVNVNLDTFEEMPKYNIQEYRYIEVNHSLRNVIAIDFDDIDDEHIEILSDPQAWRDVFEIKPPNILVRSDTGFHAIWLLDKPIVPNPKFRNYNFYQAINSTLLEYFKPYGADQARAGRWYVRNPLFYGAETTILHFDTVKHLSELQPIGMKVKNTVSKKYIAKQSATYKEGDRNNHIYALLMRFFSDSKFTLTLDDLIDLGRSIDSARKEEVPPLPDREIVYTAKRVFKRKRALPERGVMGFEPIDWSLPGEVTFPIMRERQAMGQKYAASARSDNVQKRIEFAIRELERDGKRVTNAAIGRIAKVHPNTVAKHRKAGKPHS